MGIFDLVNINNQLGDGFFVSLGNAVRALPAFMKSLKEDADKHKEYIELMLEEDFGVDTETTYTEED